MTANRSTKAEYEARCEEAADLLAEGWPGRVVVKKLSEKFQVTARQARSYVKEGERLAKEAVPVHDRAFLFAQTFAGLQADRMDARESGNINAQVGASKQLVQMLKLMSDIDPMRDFETAFMQAAAAHLNNNKGSIPRVRLSETGSEEAPF